MREIIVQPEACQWQAIAKDEAKNAPLQITVS